MKHLITRKTYRPPYALSAGVLVFTAACYLGTWAFCALVPWYYGVPPENIFVKGFEPHKIVLLAAMAVLAILRTTQNHPGLDSKYGKWLALTPWEYPMPLPLGSPQLDRRDALLLGCGVAVGWWGSHLNTLLPLIAFGLGYLVVALAVLRDTRVWPAGYGIAFGLAAVVRVWPAYPLIVAIVAVLHVLAWLGLGVSLQQFRQRREPRPDLARTARNLGWPFTHLNPIAPPSSIPFRHTAALALLAGWWAYSITAHFEAFGAGGLAFVRAIEVGFLVALVRLGIYTAGIRPPAGVLGRIGSGRWIIPGYDRVLLAPLCILATTVLAGAGGYVAAVKCGVSYAVLSGGMIGLVTLLAIALGPTLRDWRLCGEFSVLRRAPPTGNGRTPSSRGGNRGGRGTTETN